MDPTDHTSLASEVRTRGQQALAQPEFGKAAEALPRLIELAEMTGRPGRTGKTDLN